METSKLLHISQHLMNLLTGNYKKSKCMFVFDFVMNMKISPFTRYDYTLYSDLMMTKKRTLWLLFIDGVQLPQG